MTVASASNKDTYLGDGSTTTWPITFDVGGILAAEIKVYLTNISTGVSTLVTSDYTVDLTSLEVEYPLVADPPTSSYKVILLRELEATQEVDYKNQGTIPAETIEASLDRQAMLVAQLQEQIERCVIADVSADDSPINELTAQVIASAAAAAASAAAALISEGAASDSEDAAAVSETNAAASAATAVAAAAEGLYGSVVALDFSDSPYTPSIGQEGHLFTIDTSGGDFVVNLSALSVYGEDNKYAFVKDTADANTITINRGGSDTINGGVSAVIDTQYITTVIIGDLSETSWTTADQGVNWSDVDIDGGNINDTTITDCTIVDPTITGYATRTLVWYIPFPEVGANASAKIRVPFDGTIVRSQAYVNTAPTGASLIVDINQNGSTIGASKLTIAASGTADDEDTFSGGTEVEEGDYFTVDVDQIGSTIAGEGLCVMLDIEI